MAEADSREAAIESYEVAEAAYLAAVRDRLSHDQLALKAAAVASAADLWQHTAYRDFSRLRDEKGDADRDVIELEIDAERAELLHGLWSDIRDAHSGREVPSPGVV